MENWVKFNLLGQHIKKVMKKNVVPHRFACQEDRKRTASSSEPRQAFLKRQRINTLKELEDELPSTSIQCDHEEPLTGEEDLECSTSGSTSQDVAVQVNMKVHYRSKYSQIAPSTTNTASSPFKVQKIDVSTTTSNVKIGKNVIDAETCMIDAPYFPEGSSNHSSATDCEWNPDISATGSGVESLSSNYEEELLKSTSVSRTIQIIKKKPQHYIGVPENCYFIIELLSKAANISENNIMLILKKIRLNNSFVELADDFGISTSQASKIFCKYIPIIAQHMKSFVFWPKSETIVANLPIPFRHRYNHVQSIIDAFEIEIEKPSDPVKQALSWSEYKKCNTIKYLISSTPDGVINFISPGFSGRISDTTLLEECGYLQVLPVGASVMADRGFKHIEHLLINRSCKLIRPPSVEHGRKPSKKEVLETKRIASLRIHIERTIRRIREFKFLKPHSCINNKSVSLADDIVIIAAALINLQSPLIKM